MFSNQILAFFFVAAGAIYLMMAAGVQKRALEWKRTTRACPSCGARSRDCRCRRHP